VLEGTNFRRIDQAGDLQFLEDVRMLVEILLMDQLVKSNHQPGPLLLSRTDAVDRFDLPGYPLCVPIQQFRNVAADLSKQFSEDLMKVFKIFA